MYIFLVYKSKLIFHTGTFVFESEIDGRKETTRFVRNDSIEIDYYQGKAYTASVRWINNCEIYTNQTSS